MAVNFGKTEMNTDIPVFYRGDVQELPSGYRLLNVEVGDRLRVGQLIRIVEGTLTANVCKVAKLLNKTTTQELIVTAGSLFRAGDVVMVSGGKKGVAISKVTKKKDGTVHLSLSEALEGAVEGAIIIEADSAGDNQAPKHLPNSAVVLEKVVQDEDTTVSCVGRGVIIRSHITMPSEFADGILLAGNPNILVVNQ